MAAVSTGSLCGARPLGEQVDSTPGGVGIRTELDRPKCLMRLGKVPRRLMSVIEEAWRPDIVDGPPEEGCAVVTLFEPDLAPSHIYTSHLEHLAYIGCTVGVLPALESDAPFWPRMFSGSPINVDFGTARLIVGDSPEASDARAPKIIRGPSGAPCPAEEIARAQLLCLSGHASPFDAKYGADLILCTRHLYREGDVIVAPCCGTNRCFRQSQFARVPGSDSGLVKPEDLNASVLILDGCNTAPIPGSLFGYSTSIARGVVRGRARVAVLTHGVTTTSFDTWVLLLAMLAWGHTLGAAVRDANLLQAQRANARSLLAPGASPWVVLGDPTARVTGIPAIGTGRLGEVAEMAVGETGMFTCLLEAPQKTGETRLPARWFAGAPRPTGGAFVWAVPHGAQKQEENAGASRLCQGGKQPLAWSLLRERIAGSRGLLERAAALVPSTSESRHALAHTHAGWEQVETKLQYLLGHTRNAAHSWNPSLEEEEQRLGLRARVLDQMSAGLMGFALTKIGRSQPLWGGCAWSAGPCWSPVQCRCGCDVVAQSFTRWGTALQRILMTCPACGQLADVPGRPGGGEGEHQLDTDVRLEASVCAQGDSLSWMISRSTQGGYACCGLVDPFRENVRLEGVLELSEGRSICEMAIPSTWPIGLARGHLAISSMGGIYLFYRDVVVSKRSADGAAGSSGARRDAYNSLTQS